MIYNSEKLILIKGSKEVEKKKFLVFSILSIIFSVLFAFLIGFNIDNLLEIKLLYSFLILIFLLIALGVISIFAFKLLIIFDKNKDLVYVYTDHEMLYFSNNKKIIHNKEILNVEIKVNKYFFKHEKSGGVIGTIIINTLNNSYIFSNCLNVKKVKEIIDNLLSF